MLKALVLALLAANVLVFAWGQGWLSPLLLPPGASEREPERMLRQIEPGSIQVRALPADNGASAAASAGAATR
jgi:hypothetical protein